MSIIKSTLTLVGSCALALTLAACADESPWNTTSGEKGSIELTLSADYSFDKAAPLSRSGDDATADLKTYTSVIPEVSDFKIRLEKNDGSLMKDWSSFEDFSSYAKDHEFTAGLYTISAYYGDKEDVGTDKPYFEAESTFTILAGRKSTINLNAQLKNAMVVVNYTQKFKDYMDSYSSTLNTHDPEVPSVEMLEGKAIFMPAVEADVKVDFTTKLTKQSANISTGTFASMPKTLRNITFDVVENDNGASLNITFDESLDGHKDVSIDLTQDLYTTPAPVINCTGFTNGETVNTTGSAAGNANIAMSVTAEGGVNSALLSVKGPESYTQDWGAQIASGSYQIDLASGTDLSSYGIKSQGFAGGKAGQAAVATLNLSDFVKRLPQGHEYTISVVITDFNAKANEPVIVKINSEDLAINRVAPSNPSSTEATYNSDIVNVSLAYNGEDPKEITFKDSNNNIAEVQTISYNGEAIFTRAFESKVYEYTLKLNSATKLSAVALTAYKGSEKIAGDINIPVKLPGYEISEFDAFAKYAYLKVVPASASDLNLIMDNIKVYLNNSTSAWTNISKTTENGYGIITLSGLSSSENSGTTYSVSSSITGGEVINPAKFPGSTSNSVTNSFTTEVELSIPNGDFSDRGSKTTSGKLNVGGSYKGVSTYQITSTYEFYFPTDVWASINGKTAWSGANNQNTWFVVPSTWINNDGQCEIRSVGYHHNGKTPDTSSSYSGYYCRNTPEELIPIAGELFLGSYSFDGAEHRTEGIAFSSRPKSISFDYNYSLNDKLKDKEDNGYVSIEIIGVDGNTINYKTCDLNPGSENQKTIKLDYDLFGKKANKLRIKFMSSNAKSPDTPPIYVPSGDELKEGLGAPLNKQIDANTYHALATGSVLTIDNVKANY